MTGNQALGPLDWVDEDCKRFWNDALQGFGSGFEQYLRRFLADFGSLLKSSTGFRVRVVVDTNVALSEVRRLLSGKPPFLTKLSRNPFLETLAPPEMLQEFAEKIREMFPGPEEQARALRLAEDVVKSIRIERGFRIDSRVRAEALMGQRDPEDVVFVQIALEYETHGVVSKDKSFINLGEVKRWELGEVGRVVTEMNRGALTLWVAARGLPFAALVLVKLGMMVIAIGFRSLEALVSMGLGIGQKVVTAVTDFARANPLVTAAALIGAIAFSFLLMSWEPSRRVIDGLTVQGERAARQVVSAIGTAVDRISSAVSVLVDASKEELPVVVRWLDCLASSSLLLLRRIQELERIRT